MVVMAQSVRPVIQAHRVWLAPRLSLHSVCRLAALVLASLLPLVDAAAASEVVLPVPRVTIYPGDTITESMLVDRAFRGRDYAGPDFAATHEALVGKVARQTLLPSAPVAATAVREPFAIKQGQPAVVYFQSGGLIISATAVPLQPGSAGELISLRNTDSGTTIRGIVQPDGTVRVGMP